MTPQQANAAYAVESGMATLRGALIRAIQEVEAAA